MNDILAEINLKRKTLSDPVIAGPSKYLKKSDLEKARAEEERLRREEADRPAREAREAKAKKAKEDVGSRLGSQILIDRLKEQRRHRLLSLLRHPQPRPVGIRQMQEHRQLKASTFHLKSVFDV